MIKFAVKEFWQTTDSEVDSSKYQIESQISQFLEKRPEIQVIDVKFFPEVSGPKKIESRALLIYRTTN